MRLAICILFGICVCSSFALGKPEASSCLFGNGCRFNCHCLDPQERCDVVTGKCTSGCDWEWGGPGCQYKNIAKYGKVQVSNERDAENTTDRDLNTCTNLGTEEENLTLNTWWRIDFDQNYTFTDLSMVTHSKDNLIQLTVTVDYSTSSAHGTSSTVDGELCYKTGRQADASDVLYISCEKPIAGNEVTIQFLVFTEELSLCDVRIFLGRNLLPQSTAVYGLNAYEFFDKNCTVDGTFCNSSNETDVMEVMTVNIGFTANIRYLSIQPLKDDQKPTFSFVLDVSNDSEVWINVYENKCEAGEIYEIPLFTVTMLRVTIVNSSALLLIPKLEVFGDCASHTCGYDCSKVCHCSDTTIWHRMSGTCSSGCLGRWTGLGTRCDTECAVSKWGLQCQQDCGFCANQEICDVFGTCPSGCVDGYLPEQCTAKCPAGHYGQECSVFCGMNCEGGIQNCAHDDGRCLKGCAPGWKGLLCKEMCPPGKWGYECKQSCGHCRATVCEHTDGKCTHGCAVGYVTSHACFDECPAGTYGEACLNICSQNCVDVCNHYSGTCKLCTAGWKGQNCTNECEFGEWGGNCNKTCGKCDGGKTCNRSTGHCPAGCLPGYQKTDFCMQECPRGTYGYFCSRKCSLNCFDICNTKDGSCDPCRPGWKGKTCDTKCEADEWGPGCLLQCGKCSGSKGCDRFKGQCTSDCLPGYYSTERCDKECRDGTFGKNCKDLCSPNCIGVCNKVDGSCKYCAAGWKDSHCNTECRPGEWGFDCKRTCGKCAGNDTCDKFEGICKNGCMPGFVLNHFCTEEQEQSGTKMENTNETKGSSTTADSRAVPGDSIVLPLSIVWKAAVGVGAFVIIAVLACVVKRLMRRKVTVRKDVDTDAASSSTEIGLTQLPERRQMTAAAEGNSKSRVSYDFLYHEVSDRQSRYTSLDLASVF